MTDGEIQKLKEDLHTTILLTDDLRQRILTALSEFQLANSNLDLVKMGIGTIFPTLFGKKR